MRPAVWLSDRLAAQCSHANEHQVCLEWIVRPCATGRQKEKRADPVKYGVVRWRCVTRHQEVVWRRSRGDQCRAPFEGTRLFLCERTATTSRAVAPGD